MINANHDLGEIISYVILRGSGRRGYSDVLSRIFSGMLKDTSRMNEWVPSGLMA